MSYLEERCSGIVAICPANRSTRLTSIDYSCLKLWFSISIICFYVYCHSTIRMSSLVSPIDLIILVWTRVLFQWSNCRRVGQWDSFSLTPVYFWHVPIIFWEFFYYIAKQGVPGLSYTSGFGISRIFRVPWILLVKNSIWKSRYGHLLC